MPDSLHKRLEGIKQYGWGVHEERPNESGPWVRLSDVLAALDQPGLGEDCGHAVLLEVLGNMARGGYTPAACPEIAKRALEHLPPDPPQVSDEAVEAAARVLSAGEEPLPADFEECRLQLEAALPHLRPEQGDEGLREAVERVVERFELAHKMAYPVTGASPTVEQRARINIWRQAIDILAAALGAEEVE